MKWFWKVCGWGLLIGAGLFLLFIAYCIDAMVTEWSKPAQPFLAHIREAIFWIGAVSIISFFEKVLARIANTLDAILQVSEETRKEMKQLKWSIQDDHRTARSLFD